MSESEHDIPRGNAAGFTKYLKQDLVSGFLVFLIALPLCLSIALAYGYPPIAGVFTAIIGGIVTTFLSNSELTIKGPAAGLIAIAAPCMMYFGWSGVPGDINLDAYRAALAVGVAAGAVQVLFGIFRVGSLGEFFPSSVVHGMLAAIGVIILAKQIPPTVGVSAKGEPLALLMGLPEIFRHMNPSITAVGLVSLLIMFVWPMLKAKALKAIPAAMVVIVVAIPMAKALELSTMHTNLISLEAGEHEAEQGHANTDSEHAAGTPVPKGDQTAAAETKTDTATGTDTTTDTGKTAASDTLIKVPRFGETFDVLTVPRFEVLSTAGAWWWVAMFAIIGTLESMLSAKAMDLIDPYERTTNLDRDNIAVGTGNMLCAFVGAAPMISEIVRSRANMDNGARTRFANFHHAILLLLFVSLLPFVVNMIPIAALAAMLIYTGYRLAHPREFVHVFQIGREQLIVYCVTIVSVLATDLLVGIAIGMVAKLLIHIINGAPFGSLFKPCMETEEDADGTLVVRISESAVFTNWLPIRKRIVTHGLNQGKNVAVDLSGAMLVDHTVMENLHNLGRDFVRDGLTLTVDGFDTLQPIGRHEHSARKRGLAMMRRIMVIADESLESRIEHEFVNAGATGFTVLPCRGVGRRDLTNGEFQSHSQVCIEVIVPGEIGDRIIEFLRRDIMTEHHVTAFVENVEALRADQFTGPESLSEFDENGTAHEQKELAAAHS